MAVYIPLVGALHALMRKQATEMVRTRTSLTFFNQLFLVPKSNNKWRPILESSEVSKIENRDTRKYKDLPLDRRMSNIHRLQGCLLPYTNIDTVQERPHPRSILPIQSSTVQTLRSPHGVHNSIEKG